jgi:hypothetical protein
VEDCDEFVEGGGCAEDGEAGGYADAFVTLLGIKSLLYNQGERVCPLCRVLRPGPEGRRPNLLTILEETISYSLVKEE